MQHFEDQAANIDELVNYLREISVRAKGSISNAFHQEQSSRLFFNLCEIQTNEGVNELCHAMLTDFTEKFLQISLQLNLNNILHVQHSVINYFFKFIENSQAWQLFWNEEISKMDKLDEAIITKNRIAGAFTYRLLLDWCMLQANADMNIETIKKKYILTKISACINPIETIKECEIKIKRKFDVEFTMLSTQKFSDKQLEKSAMKEAKRQINNALNDPFFAVLEKAVFQLEELYRERFFTPQATRLARQSVAADAILQYIYNYHLEALQSDHQPQDILSLITTIKAHVSKKVMQECKPILKFIPISVEKTSSQFMSLFKRNDSFDKKKEDISNRFSKLDQGIKELEIMTERVRDKEDLSVRNDEKDEKRKPLHVFSYSSTSLFRKDTFHSKEVPVTKNEAPEKEVLSTPNEVLSTPNKEERRRSLHAFSFSSANLLKTPRNHDKCNKWVTSI